MFESYFFFRDFVNLIDSQDPLPTSFARPKQTTALKFSWQLENNSSDHQTQSGITKQNQEEWTYTKVMRRLCYNIYNLIIISLLQLHNLICCLILTLPVLTATVNIDIFGARNILGIKNILETVSEQKL